MIKTILNFFRIPIYIVVANCDCKDKLKECRVYLNVDKARKAQAKLVILYGAENVALFSRFLFGSNDNN